MQRASKTQQVQTRHPVIDQDPHFKRVVAYMRPSDYITWAGLTGAFPGAFWIMQAVDPTRIPRGGMAAGVKLCTVLGAFGGFLFAYQRSSVRLWGWEENSVEVAKAKEEGLGKWTTDRASTLDPHMQGVAHRNSQWSQLKFSVFPFFNLVNHPYHGPGLQEEESTAE